MFQVHYYLRPMHYGRFFPSFFERQPRRCFRGCSLSFQQKSSQDGGDKDLPSARMDGFEASSRWRRDQLNSISDKFLGDASTKFVDRSQSQRNQQQQQQQQQQQPLEIASDDEVQPMWREMESRVLRRKSVTVAEALTKGMKIGRRNIRSTDEDVWLDAGLYHNNNSRNTSDATSEKK